MAMALPLLFNESVRRIHAVGVGGMGLGPLAIYLAKGGWLVSGEDDSLNPTMKIELERAGVVLTGTGDLKPGIDLLVFSSAIAPAHPTRLKAAKMGVPQVKRGHLLAEISKNKRLVGVAGSHGKTSVTAMLIAALKHSQWNGGYVLGGLFANEAWAPAEAGRDDWLIVEIDESDGTIESFSPEMLIVVNLDWDHPDHYESVEQLKATFAQLGERTRGVVLGWKGCPQTASIQNESMGAAQMVTFGADGDFSFKVTESNLIRQTLALSGRFGINAAKVQAKGRFNAINATGALAAVQLMGWPLQPGMLADFPGVKRRQTELRRDGDLTVLEDYAHHPAEVRALLQSLKSELKVDQRLVVVFQPHRFSRTLQFKSEFAAALAFADSLHLLDVYPAGESFRVGGTTADLRAEILLSSPDLRVNYVPNNASRVLEILRQSRQPGDCVVFVGAGDIEKMARDWLRRVDQAAGGEEKWNKLADLLRKELSELSTVNREEVLAKKTTLRVGGAARVYVEPADVDDLQRVVRISQAMGVPHYVLGRGSNLLIPDTGVDGVVVAMRHKNWATFSPLDDGRVSVGAGLRLKNLCGLAAKAGLEGFEFLEGIPGNVGGALRMNAGAMGGWMFDVVDEVEAIDSSGHRVTWQRTQLHTGYRHCEELREAIAIGAILRSATKGQADNIGRQIDVYRSKRQESQPREPSAGCIFKNPEGDSAGRLIEQSGLKGTRIGDAEISMVHGNFIVNRGSATSAEVIDLVKRVRSEVNREVGILLEPEVLLYGARWEDVL